MTLSQNTKDAIKALVGVLIIFAVVFASVSLDGHVKAGDHERCITAASEEGIDGPSIVLLCGKM